MLHLCVFVESVDQPGERLCAAPDGFQTARLILGRDFSGGERVRIARDHRDGRFDVVGDIRDHALAVAVKPFPLPFALREPVGEHVEGFPDAFELAHVRAVPHTHGAALHLRQHRVVQTIQRQTDRASDPSGKERPRQHGHGQKQQPHAPRGLIGRICRLFVGKGGAHEKDAGFPVRAREGEAGEGSARGPQPGQNGVFAPGVPLPSVPQAAGHHAQIAVQLHLLTAAVLRVAGDTIPRFTVPVLNGVSFHMGAGAVVADAGKLPLCQSAEGFVRAPEETAVRRKHGETVRAAEIGAQSVIVSLLQPAVRQQLIPVRDAVDPVNTGAPQPIHAPRRDGQRQGEQQKAFCQQGGQPALLTLQFYIPARGS